MKGQLHAGPGCSIQMQLEVQGSLDEEAGKVTPRDNIASKAVRGLGGKEPGHRILFQRPEVPKGVHLQSRRGAKNRHDRVGVTYSITVGGQKCSSAERFSRYSPKRLMMVT